MRFSTLRAWDGGDAEISDEFRHMPNLERLCAFTGLENSAG